MIPPPPIIRVSRPTRIERREIRTKVAATDERAERREQHERGAQPAAGRRVTAAAVRAAPER